MGDLIRLGPLLVKTSWLIVAISLTCGYLFCYYYLQKNIDHREKINEAIWNSLFFFLITWKLSPIIYRMSVIINDPLLLLYFSPGNKETLFAIAMTIIFLLYQVIRLNLSFYAVFNSILTIYVMAAFSFYFFAGNIYYMALFLFFTSWLIYKQYAIDSSLLFRNYLIFISAGQIVINIFNHYPYVLGMHAFLFWFLFLITGVLLDILYGQILRAKVKNQKRGG